jgi:hypothetical protein
LSLPFVFLIRALAERDAHSITTSLPTANVLWHSFARMDISIDQVQKRRFTYGVALAWVPWLFFIPGFMNAFRGIASSKATGLAAVAGGLTEALVPVGFASILVLQISAVVMLRRSVSKEHRFRGFVAMASLFCCAFTLFMLIGSVAAFLYLSQLHP